MFKLKIDLEEYEKSLTTEYLNSLFNEVGIEVRDKDEDISYQEAVAGDSQEGTIVASDNLSEESADQYADLSKADELIFNILCNESININSDDDKLTTGNIKKSLIRDNNLKEAA